jgi:hypothetical protein
MWTKTTVTGTATSTLQYGTISARLNVAHI